MSSRPKKGGKCPREPHDRRWGELAVSYCNHCENKYGQKKRFAAICVCLPGQERDEVVVTQDLYLVAMETLVKTCAVNKHRTRPLTTYKMGEVSLASSIIFFF